jgi:hypothetical protein
MDVSPEDRRRILSVPWTAIAFVLVLTPVLYVLSIGPAGWLVDAGHLSRSRFHSLYAPVVWLHDRTLLEQPLEWYGGLWGW